MLLTLLLWPLLFGLTQAVRTPAKARGLPLSGSREYESLELVCGKFAFSTLSRAIEDSVIDETEIPHFGQKIKDYVHSKTKSVNEFVKKYLSIVMHLMNSGIHQETEKGCANCDSKLMEMDTEIEMLQRSIQEKIKKLERQRQRKIELQNKIKSQQRKIEKSKNHIQNSMKTIADKKADIGRLQSALNRQQVLVGEVSQGILDSKTRIKTTKDTIDKGLVSDNACPQLARLAPKRGYSKVQYAAVIDAGSTGSRVLAYKFNRSFIGNKLVLYEELFKARRPGLSSFADNPAKGAHSIKLLLDEARAFIPKQHWSSTPLVLKATAGLRLLPARKAENLLKAVRNLFAKSQFSVNRDAVEIMDGADEGIYGWFTVNFLLGRLSKTNQVAALDLGGGSTQVTFSLTDHEQLPVYDKYMHEVATPNKKINVFTHSYLGLGLMAARHAVFTKGYSAKETVVESVCVNPILANHTWVYGNVKYKVSGKKNSKSCAEHPMVDFDACLELVKSKVMPLMKPKPITLKQHTIAAFSNYFDRANESGLVHSTAGGETTVAAYRKKAQEICAIPNDEQPFMCFDLTYISVLLREGFGLNDGKKLKLYKKIDGHEISWALGCAYNVLIRGEKSKISKFSPPPRRRNS